MIQTLNKNLESELLIEQFRRVRQFSQRIAAPLSAEDCVVQSMPDVSPTLWHLAHTTWFFETFVLKDLPGYEPFHPGFEYLFNSYYNAVGQQYPRPRRGLLSRPGFSTVLEYRRSVDDAVETLLQNEELDSDAQRVLALGLHHEQQHQELMLTDIKHVLSCNPLFPAYHESSSTDWQWDAGDNHRSAGGQNGSDEVWDDVSADLSMACCERFSEGIIEIGHSGSGFCYDNEQPRHRVFVEDFELAGRTVTNGEYRRFVEAGGYRQPEHWLSMGTAAVEQENWSAPLYWICQDEQWFEFTLGGLQPLNDDAPVTHVSYFEADAFARWAGYRLPTEAEWELAASARSSGARSSENRSTEPPSPQTCSPAGHFADRLIDGLVHPRADAADGSPLQNMFGNVWEWTSSQYTPYPGYAPPTGALGEYNGKFMCNQFVLRGGSCATLSDHIRTTYRNFFPPEARWQFSGIRLARG